MLNSASNDSSARWTFVVTSTLNQLLIYVSCYKVKLTLHYYNWIYTMTCLQNWKNILHCHISFLRSSQIPDYALSGWKIVKAVLTGESSFRSVSIHGCRKERFQMFSGHSNVSPQIESEQFLNMYYFKIQITGYWYVTTYFNLKLGCTNISNVKQILCDTGICFRNWVVRNLFGLILSLDKK